MSSPAKIDPPLYRVANANGAFVNGSLHACGAEVGFPGWPRPRDLTPINDTAKRIAAYYTKYGAHVGFPRTAWSAEWQCYYLPGMLQNFHNAVPSGPFNPPGSDLRGLVEDGQADADLEYPRYRMKVSHRIGRRDLKAGETFRFIGWAPETLAEPANEPARKVAAYLAKHANNPKRPFSPWCQLRGLFLPPLPEADSPADATPTDLRTRRAVNDAITNVRGRPPGVPGQPPRYPKSGVTTGFNSAPPFKPGS